MGQVWLAEQSAPVKPQVALKIVKALRYDDSALVRFDLERQALAIMDHPSIAKVFDAGSTAEGHSRTPKQLNTRPVHLSP